MASLLRTTANRIYVSSWIRANTVGLQPDVEYVAAARTDGMVTRSAST
jgi:hypothetical protein